MSVRDESFVLDGRIFWPPIDGESLRLMNHHDHEHSDHVNGQQVNGEAMTEEELDACEDRLTNEAVLDQVNKGISPPLETLTQDIFCGSRTSSIALS